MRLYCILLILVMEGGAFNFDEGADPKTAGILLMKNIPWDGKKYFFGYLTTHGILMVERGFLKKTTNGNEYLVKVGAYTRILNNNEGYIVKYYSNDKGHHEKLTTKLKESQISNLRSLYILTDESSFIQTTTQRTGVSDVLYSEGPSRIPITSKTSAGRERLVDIALTGMLDLTMSDILSRLCEDFQLPMEDCAL